MSNPNYGHWVTEFDFDVTEYCAFVYLIEFPLIGKKYIGAKMFHLKCRTTPSELKHETFKKSDWKRYKSSSKYVNELIDSGHTWRGKILSLHATWDSQDGALHEEERLLILNDVLNNQDTWLNKNIRGTTFVTATVISEETRGKISIANKGSKRSEEAKAKMSAAKKGRPALNKGSKHTEETKAKMSAAKKGKSRPPQPIVTCPHCGKRGGSYTMKRWHFARCKSKPVL